MDISEFDLHAKVEDVHWWFKARREIILTALRKYLPAHQNKMVTEIGCGTGGNLKFLKDYYRVMGVDISPVAVKYASERAGCSVFLGDFREQLADKWQEIDAVILADILEHIDDDNGFLKDVIEPLKQDAVVLITVPAHNFLWSGHDVALGHKRRYSAGSLRLLWDSLDVEEVFFTPFNSFLYPAIALFRMLKPGNSDRRSDLYLPSSWVNHLFYGIFSSEKTLIEFFPLPCGVSYLTVLRKKRQER